MGNYNDELPLLPLKRFYRSLEVKGESLVLSDRKSRKVMPIRSIASFEVKRWFGSGVITIKLQTGNDNFMGSCFFPMDDDTMAMFACGMGNEIQLDFSLDYRDLAERYEDYVCNYSTRGFQQTGSVNDLRTLKQLLDEGIITEEEFRAKKKQILGI